VSTDSASVEADLQSLLQPISAEEPSGSYLLYEGTYKEIRQARLSEEDDTPRGVWTRDLKASDWGEVRNLCTNALLEATKDLQIAAWLTEAWFHLYGAAGLARGVDLMLSLSESFWESVHPGLSDGIEFRAAPFFWVNEKFPDMLTSLVVARPEGEPERAVRWGDWKRALWLDSLRQRRPDDQEVQAEYESALSVADALRAAEQSQPGFFADLQADLVQTIELTRQLESFLDDRMGPDSPSLVRFREALEEIVAWAGGRLAVFEDDPEVPVAEVELDPSEIVDDAEPPAGPSRPPQKPGAIQNRADAYARLIEAARYLKEVEPHSPTPYLVMRAVAWGDKSLDELLREFVQQGLNLEALFIFLGIEGPER
jgi:type VI secretion system ImpA family protein